MLKAMAEESPVLDAARQEEARAYARKRTRLRSWQWTLGLLYLLAWTGLGLNAVVRRGIESLVEITFGTTSAPWWGTVLLMAAILWGPWQAFTAPLDFYTGYVLPQRYRMSTQGLKDWLADQAKALLVSAAIGVPLLVALYGLLRVDASRWWLWFAVGYIAFSIILTALSPVFLVPLFYKSEPLEERHADLQARLTALAERVQTRVAGVYRFDMSRRTRAANAVLAGMGRTRRILIADTLLDEFTPDEIETILAHELAHHAHRDIPLSVAVQGLLAIALFFLVDVGLGVASKPFHLANKADPAGLPLLVLLVGLISLFVLPLMGSYSRWRESLADDFAMALTGKPKALAAALTRLANQNLVEVAPKGWLTRLTQTHPPLRARIEKAERLALPR